jgi:S1-C subfamily serine protease
MRRIALAWLVAAAMGQDQIGADAAEKAKPVTVMINATIDDDARPGTGIIFALANDQIYIATANHLVRRGTSEARDIRVEFKWLPGQPVPAQLLTNYDDRALDLAVIVVDIAKARAGQVGLSFERLGDPSKLTRGAAVSAIGYPNGTAYDVSGGQINQVEAVLLKYRVQGLMPGGYSGGPLVDRNGLIVE